MLFQVEYLLYELREPILLTACWLTLRTEMKTQMRPYVDIYITLASVCDGFYEVVRDRRFKRIIKRYLKGLLLLGVFLFHYKRLIKHCHRAVIPELDVGGIYSTRPIKFPTRYNLTHILKMTKRRPDPMHLI